MRSTSATLLSGSRGSWGGRGRPHGEVFYVNEADVDLSPRIGFSGKRYREQTTVPTPGQNQRHCIAGAALGDTHGRSVE